MCRKPLRTATALTALLGSVALAAPVSAWPFAPKPAASTPPAAAPASKATTPADDGPKKASPQERAAAERMDPLARSVFWAHEANQDLTDAQAWISLAASLRALGRYQEAGESVDKVLVLYPADLDALLEKARDHIGAGKGFYALDPLRKAEAAAPRDWRVYSLMAVAREQNRQPDEAHAAYEQALVLSPDNPGVLSNLGLWYASHGQRAEAETYLRRAAAQPTATAQERQNLALVLGMEGRLAEAERLMREDLPPDVADANLAYLREASKTGGHGLLPPGPMAQAR
jgi:Flp pilus assembly protein TadD